MLTKTIKAFWHWAVLMQQSFLLQKNLFMKKQILYLLSLFVIVFATNGCNTKTDITTPGPAIFLLTQTSPDAPNVDFVVNNQLVFTNVPPYDSSLYYLGIPGGIANFKVAQTGSSSLLLDENIDLAPNTAYSIFTVDSLNKISFAVVVDSFSTPSSDTALLRFFNFSPNSPAVDLALTGDTVLLFANRTFNDQAVFTSYGGFGFMNPATYNFEIRETGTSTVLYNFMETFEGGKAYTIYAKGFIGGIGTQAFGTSTIANN